jgi:hypothetical protein
MASAWYEFIDEAPVEPSYPKGLVFDWPGMKGTQAVLHDWDHAIPWFDGNVRVVCGPKSKNAQLLVIEQFGPFLDRTLENWII